MFRFRLFYLSYLLGALLSGFGAGAQGRTEVGAPPIRIYAPGQYDAHSQNFALTQDTRGVIYAGNFAGVLEYDGLNWRTIPTAHITKVSALLTAASGTVCVGANGEFGYLRPDSTGTLRFQSLSDQLKTPFREILAVLELPDGIYFVARNAVFRWDGKIVRTWPRASPITSAFQLGKTLYLFQQQRGLTTFAQGQWRDVPRQAGLPPLYDLVGMLALPGNKPLLVTSSQGLFQLANGLISPFASTASGLLQANQATGAIGLPDHSLVVSTVRGGLVLLDADGQLRQSIRSGAGLSEQLINAMFVDREGSLWLALNNGLAQLEVPSPLTLFSEASRLTGEVVDIRRVKGVLYLAAANGLFQLQGGEIRPVPGMNIACSGLAEAADGGLFVATSRGLYRLAAGAAPQLLTPDYALCVATVRADPAQVYVGTQNGVVVCAARPGRAPTYENIPGLTERIFGIREGPDGSLWLETLTAGLYRWLPATRQLRHYTTRQGLPTLLYNHVVLTSLGLLAYADQGIYRFDDARDRFVAANPFGGHQVADNWKNLVLEDRQGSIWTVEGDKKTITQFQPAAGRRRVAITTPFLPLSTSPITVIYPDRQGVVWMGGRDGVVRYDAGVRKRYTQPYDALLRRVQTVGERTLFNGAPAVPNSAAPAAVALAPEANDISFEFAAATYPVVQALTFQYQLENYDRVWSDWTEAGRKEYTNLPPGEYRFRVRSRNIYATPSREAAYAFTVLAPWYGRWWGIALLVAAGALALSALVRWRLAAVEREKQALELLIGERTEEVVSQKAELEKQSEELAIKNDQLEKIDLIVQSINAEIDFANLFQTILAKFSVIRNMNSASFLIYDKPTDSFRFKALRGNRELADVQAAQLTLEQAEDRYLTGAVEVYEDIYLKNRVVYTELGNAIDALAAPQSLITIVIETEGRIEGFITLENTTRAEAFDQRDISMICNLKEHLIAAFIKTRLLESLEHTLNDLENTQGELIRQERLASVGQLTKGIVDRILNPLNYVTNFSQSSDEVIGEVAQILEKEQGVLSAATLDDLRDELQVLKTNSLKIQEHSNSTTRILKDMQKLLREKSREFIETDLHSFLENKTQAAIQELKGEYKALPIRLNFQLTPQPVRVSLLPFEFGQVVQHLVSNACYTLFEKSKTSPEFTPELRISTERTPAEQVVVRLRDNGKGIPPRELARMFSPFFTTKPTSKGTGLGLFMTKDIIETHKGKIEIDSREGEFTELTITLPVLPAG